MTATGQARISVVIPTYRRRASVERALRALVSQTLPPDAYEVIVSVDGSEDGTREMILDLPTPYRLYASFQPNRGRAAACNAGARLAGAGWIVFLDDDMEPTPGLLEAHLRAHGPGSHLGVMGAAPIVLGREMPSAAQYMAIKFNRHLERLARNDRKLTLRDFYTGNFSISRDAFLTVGGFDEDFNIYGNEDLELSIRLARAGVRIVYEPEAIACQHHTKSFAQLAQDSVAKGRTAVLLASKHPSALPDLQLSAYRSGSTEWRVLRAGLIGIGMIWNRAPNAFIRAIEQLEAFHPSFMDTVYRLALDYFYWTGALAALRENRQIGRGLSALSNVG